MSSFLTNYTFCCGEGEEYHARVRQEQYMREMREKLMLAEEEGNQKKIDHYSEEIRHAEGKENQLVYMQVAGLVCFCIIPVTLAAVFVLQLS